MSDRELHLEDHKLIMAQMDCSKEVSALAMRVVLLEEKLREAKEDREKSQKNLLWIGGMVFSIVMAVAGSAIQQNATVQVHEEKIMEVKKEVENVVKYFNNHEH